MGYYINPTNETKEEWLNNNGLVVTEPEWHLLATNFPGTQHSPEGRGVLVYLVDNGPFTAAAICFSEQEFNELRASDPTPEEIAKSKVRAEAAGGLVLSLDSGKQRPRTWYVVPRNHIIEVCPSVEACLEV